jgi:hypothetical protein
MVSQFCLPNRSFYCLPHPPASICAEAVAASPIIALCRFDQAFSARLNQIVQRNPPVSVSICKMTRQAQVFLNQQIASCFVTHLYTPGQYQLFLCC